MLNIVLAWAIALILALAIGPSLLKKLRELKFGQTIYELGPAHQQKQGTPIMGGFMFMIAATVASVACHPALWNGTWDLWDPILALIVFCWLTMITGFLDDYTKVTRKRNLGLKPMQKIAIQVFSALAFSVYCYCNPKLGSVVSIPFCGATWDLGLFYIPLMTLLVIFIVNSANLQDGLDGLLGSVTATSMIGWAAAAMVLAGAVVLKEGEAPDLTNNCIAVFAAALGGGAIGYLRYNLYPAKVFMGDTGSMFIGGAMVGIAMLLKQPFLLLFMAFGPIISSLSVMLQVSYFKYTKKKYGEGRRIFRMSPIHHHFEKCGWSELKIVGMYAAVTFVLSAIAVLGLWLTR